MAARESRDASPPLGALPTCILAIFLPGAEPLAVFRQAAKGAGAAFE